MHDELRFSHLRHAADTTLGTQRDPACASQANRFSRLLQGGPAAEPITRDPHAPPRAASADAGAQASASPSAGENARARPDELPMVPAHALALQAGCPQHPLRSIGDHVAGQRHASVSDTLQKASTGQVPATAALESHRASTSPTPSIASDESSSLALKQCRKLERELGLNRYQALGIIANLQHESGGMTPSKAGATAGADSAGMSGINRWLSSHRETLNAYASRNQLDADSSEANIGFIIEQLQGPHKHVLDALKNEPTMLRSATVFRNFFEEANEAQMRPIMKQGFDLIRNYKVG